MDALTLRDHLWLWGMEVNILQKTGLAFEPSTMTTEDAIRKTGIRNVLLAGHLPLTVETLRSMPSARRVIAKWGIHAGEPGQHVVAYEKGRDALLQAKEIAAAEPRVEAYLLDDFSTGSVEAGIQPERIARLQFENASRPPQLPLMCTVYEMSLENEKLWPLLPYFAGYLAPLWHAADIDNMPRYVNRFVEHGILAQIPGRSRNRRFRYGAYIGLFF